MNFASLPKFEQKHTLVRHTKPLNTLRISSDGTRLLSGGDDGILVVWDLQYGQESQVISVEFNGPVCAAVWTPPADRATAMFAFGCYDGTLFVYHQPIPELKYDYASGTDAHGRIEEIAYDAQQSRLATAGDGCVKIWDLDPQGLVTNIASVTTKPFLARSVSFYDKGQHVLICYLESHEVLSYKVEPWALQWERKLPTRIGHAIVATDNRSLIVSNLVNGIDVYSIPPIRPTRSFQHPIYTNVPLVVASALGGALTVVGSDDGSPRLFNNNTGLLCGILRHAPGGLVQVVDAYSVGNHCLLATGSTDVDVDIKIWATVEPDEEQTAQRPLSPPRLPTIGIWQFLLIIILSLVGQAIITTISKDIVVRYLGILRQYLRRDT